MPTPLRCSLWTAALLGLLTTACTTTRAPQYGGPSADVGYAASAPSQSLATLRLPAVLPRVMILVDEKSLGTIATSEVEAMAVQKLVGINVPVVDQDMVKANLARSQQMLQTAGDNRGAAALGTQFGADIVLVGEAVAKPSARRIGDTNLRSYQAVVTLRAIRADNAATLAAASEDNTQVGLEDVSGSAKALRAAAAASLDKLLPEMLSKWTPGGSAGNPANAFAHRVDLVVGGVDQVWKLRAVRESLRGKNQQVADVVQRSYTSGMAEFSVNSKLPAEELAEELVLAPPDGLRIQVLDVSAGRIQIKAVQP